VFDEGFYRIKVKVNDIHKASFTNITCVEVLGEFFYAKLEDDGMFTNYLTSLTYNDDVFRTANVRDYAF